MDYALKKTENSWKFWMSSLLKDPHHQSRLSLLLIDISESSRMRREKMTRSSTASYFPELAAFIHFFPVPKSAWAFIPTLKRVYTEGTISTDRSFTILITIFRTNSSTWWRPLNRTVPPKSKGPFHIMTVKSRMRIVKTKEEFCRNSRKTTSRDQGKLFFCTPAGLVTHQGMAQNYCGYEIFEKVMAIA
jgi:hypothetical protein